MPNVLESFLGKTVRAGAVGLCLFAGAAHAVGTRSFTIDSAAVMSDGKLEGTAVLSTGSVVASVPTRRIALAWRRSFGREKAIEVLAEAIRATRIPGATFIDAPKP